MDESERHERVNQFEQHAVLRFLLHEKSDFLVCRMCCKFDVTLVTERYNDWFSNKYILERCICWLPSPCILENVMQCVDARTNSNMLNI